MIRQCWMQCLMFEPSALVSSSLRPRIVVCALQQSRLSLCCTMAHQTRIASSSFLCIMLRLTNWPVFVVSSFSVGDLTQADASYAQFWPVHPTYPDTTRFHGQMENRYRLLVLRTPIFLSPLFCFLFFCSSCGSVLQMPLCVSVRTYRAFRFWLIRQNLLIASLLRLAHRVACQHALFCVLRHLCPLLPTF